MKTDPYHPSFVLIGAGNVATHLANALDMIGELRQVYSHNLANAKILASSFTHCTPINDLSEIDRNADFYIISVKDDCIAEVAAALYGVQGIVAHTSGSIDLAALSQSSQRTGVLYPLQTFSKSAIIDVKSVPFFIEASDEHTASELRKLASHISDKVYMADSTQRAFLHISAVFACNFVNHLWGIADEILKEKGYSLEVLHPLLRATLEKAMSMPPYEAQTGPARREDYTVIAKHLSMLPDAEQNIYALLSKSIISKSKNNTHI